MKLQNVKVKDIKENYNPRQDFSRVDDIAKSIEEMGLVLPIAVQETASGLEVVYGHQRLAALKKLGQSLTQVLVLETGDNAIESAMVVNLMRANLTMIEKARGFAHLMKERSKYNEKVISRVFGIKEVDVKFLLRLAECLDPVHDALFAKYVKMIDREDIEFIIAIPKEHQGQLFAEMERRSEPNVWAAIHAIAHPLDFNDVFKFEQAKADKKIGFVLKKHGIDHVFTFDKKYHDDAVAAYEKAQAKKYGAGEPERAEKAVAKKVESAVAKKKRQEDQARAEKALAGVVRAFMSRNVDTDQVHDLGHELCEKGLSIERARTLLRAFGAKDIDQIKMHELWEKVWEVVFWPSVRADYSRIFRVAAFLRAPMKDGKTTAQVWIEFAGRKK